MTKALYTAEQTQALDRDAIERQGLAGATLMARAAAAVCQRIQVIRPKLARLAIYAGAGNNAGDGCLIACQVQEIGKTVRLVQLVPGSSLQGDARAAWEKVQAAGVPMQVFAEAPEIEEELVVDALLGTGLSRALEGEWAQAAEQINASAATVVAVDIPTGLCADTGVADPHAVRADHTVTFIGRKRGLYTADGPDYAGHVIFSDLDVAPAGPKAMGDVLPVTLHESEDFRRMLPTRRRNSHKKDHGHVLVVGGQSGFQGATELCGAAALRTGCGLVSLAQPQAALRARLMPELMCHAVEDRRALRRLAGMATVVAVGPGLGQDAWAQDMLGEVLELSCPKVIDADALRLLAVDPRRDDAGAWVLTPHPGEAAALLDTVATEIQRDRFAAIARLQETYGGAVVLKGCGTLVADSTGDIGVCSGGNPGMATAGMGDVLTGIIAALIGQGLSPDQAALAGAGLHARAGDAASEAGMHGMVASDLLPFLQAFSDPSHED